MTSRSYNKGTGMLHVRPSLSVYLYHLAASFLPLPTYPRSKCFSTISSMFTLLDHRWRDGIRYSYWLNICRESFERRQSLDGKFCPATISSFSYLGLMRRTCTSCTPAKVYRRLIASEIGDQSLRIRLLLKHTLHTNPTSTTS